jgi:hypothetical protein
MIPQPFSPAAEATSIAHPLEPVDYLFVSITGYLNVSTPVISSRPVALTFA